MWSGLIAGTFITLASVNAVAEETIKVGLILPMTGPFTTTGKQVEAGARFYMQQNGASVDGKKIELILRDDAGIAENSRRIAQELLPGGEVALALRVPLLNPDFAPFLQRVRDASPDGVFVFIPAGQAATMMRQFVERGLDKSGIRLFGAGDITDDDLLDNMGDVALGIETAYFYSAAHPSEKNKAFVEGGKKANNGIRANFFGVSGYDGMHLIYEAIRKTGGKTDGDSFIGAVKGMSWESPRGPMAIDPETRDVISNIYMRRVERVNGELWNIEFATVENVKDPVKAAKK